MRSEDAFDQEQLSVFTSRLRRREINLQNIICRQNFSYWERKSRHTGAFIEYCQHGRNGRDEVRNVKSVKGQGIARRGIGKYVLSV